MVVGLGKYYQKNEKLQENMGKQTVVKADTIEELVQKMNVPVKALKATVKRYHALAEMGKDMDFGKPSDRMTTIDKPPFYTGTARQDFLVFLGDLNTNMHLQLPDSDRKVIPGLYVAGNMVGNRFDIDYPAMCPGLTHSFAYVTGRLAVGYAASG